MSFLVWGERNKAEPEQGRLPLGLARLMFGMSCERVRGLVVDEVRNGEDTRLKQMAGHGGAAN